MRHPLAFICAQKLPVLYIMRMSRRKEGGELYALRLVSVSWCVRFGTWVRNPDICHISGGRAPLPCGISADWLRLCLYAQVGKENGMKIVIVKSPKFLKGILRMLFGIRE